MPTYEYECLKCKESLEVTIEYDKFHEVDQYLKCKKCGGVSFKRKLAPFVTHFHYTRGKKET
jgi:putative FmdB family regulatory protein